MPTPGIASPGPAQTRVHLRAPRARAVLLALVLVPATVFFMVWGNWVSGGGGGWIDSLIMAAVSGLTLLIALNIGLQRLRPTWAFTNGEIITIYVVLVFSTGMTGSVYEWGGPIVSMITWMVWNASPENQWQQLIWPNLAPWLTVLDRDSLAGLYQGGTSPYQMQILRAWLAPVFWWTAWTSAMLWVTLCLNVIVRRRWSEEEQLSFPMTILPLQMTSPRTRLLKSPLWWTGVAVSAGISLLGIISRFLPAFPGIATSVDIGPFISNNRPWDALRTPYLSWEPWHIGLAYLMPVDLAFSMIVFNLFWRGLYVMSRILGWLTSPWEGFPYGDQQSIGGYLALMVSVIWLDRRYLVQVLRKAVGLRSVADDTQEAFSYRIAVLGAVAGIAFLWYFLARAGMTSPVTAAFLFLYLMMAMAMSRMRAHLGPPNHEMYGAMPEFALTEFPGTRALGSRALGTIVLLRPFLGEQRPNPAPVQLEALRMAERAAINPTSLAWIMVAVVPLVMLCYFWANLHIGYHLGMSTSYTHRDFTAVARVNSEKLEEWLRTPSGPSWGGVEAIGMGFAGTLVLMALKLQFPAWPLHPVAFPLAFCYQIDNMLPAIIIAWAAKAIILRYGGLRAHRRALPLFLGLLVGSASMALLQAAIYRLARISG
ncbi:MAG: DUF6785 family protein [Armatimonadota bacterium]